MLIQESTPDPKCELNITSFLTLPYSLHCPTCAKNIMVTVLLARWFVQFLEICKCEGVSRSTFIKGMPDQVH